VLTNTAVSQPGDSRIPPLIAVARSRRLLRQATVRTPTFLKGTFRLAHPQLPRDVRAAYASPYASAERRDSIGDFVEDIPLESDHPSRPTQDTVGERLSELASVPALLLWGPRDPVFSDRYLRDLQQRLPRAATHRFEGAGHLVVEDAPVADAVVRFVEDLLVRPEKPVAVPSATPVEAGEQPVPKSPPVEAGERRWLGAAIDDRANDRELAIVELGADGPTRRVRWEQLKLVVDELAAGLPTVGVRPGDRVALLVPPGADLTAALYACWRAGAVVVVADAGLGLAGLRRALRGADVTHVIGIARGLAATRAMGLRATSILAGTASLPARRAVGADHLLVDIALAGRGRPAPTPPAPSADAAVLFTSGATGPAKGVVYRHAQLEAQRDALAATLGITADDRLVAAFAPFALYGPALGIASAVPDMDVTAPATLTAAALAQAVDAVDATVVFGSPAALTNVVATAPTLAPSERDALRRVRMLLSAGAPVPVETLAAASRLMGGCQAHTPYGMTEALPVADIELTELTAVGAGNGVCVGRPVSGVRVAISALDSHGRAAGDLGRETGVTGEICVQAPHVKDRYDQLWVTERSASRETGWHRTGDVGHLDADGRLWVEGRLAHVVVTPAGPVTPVGIERRVEQVPQVQRAAAVGVGPIGTQALVMVVEAAGQRPGLASLELTDAVRAAAGQPVAAVLVVAALPVDIRHNSKIDRSAVAREAAEALAGRA
jgi:acyl-coenzyme A synthetase/AMP-(fatty) acid ligase